ncbi:hypothetical protein LC724_09555 [Blautia sp. RD014234]|nr:hypothetical protein [Blautia parvula]
MLAGHLPEKVYARGSGKVRRELEEPYGCPYAFEAAFITLQDSDITIEMERFLYGVARSYSECFRVYGENKSFEWQQLAEEDPVIYTRTGALQKVDILNEEKKNPAEAEKFWRNGSGYLIMLTFYLMRLHPSPPIRFTTMKIHTSLLSKAADTVVLTPTWYMNSSVPSWKTENPPSMISWAPTGPAPESVHMNPP